MTIHTFYKSPAQFFEKSICQLILKIYNSGEKLLVGFKDEITMSRFNDLLWTYSQKDFIPHGSVNDPLPEKQPVLLCMNNENIINANIIMNINKVDSDPITFKRTIYVCNDNDELQYEVVTRKNQLDELNLTHETWTQDANGKWLK